MLTFLVYLLLGMGLVAMVLSQVEAVLEYFRRQRLDIDAERERTKVRQCCVLLTSWPKRHQCTHAGGDN